MFDRKDLAGEQDRPQPGKSPGSTPPRGQQRQRGRHQIPDGDLFGPDEPGQQRWERGGLLWHEHDGCTGVRGGEEVEH
jgi:hypothetical protein